MSKYSKMLEKNKANNKDKIDRAIRAINEMVDKEEPLLVCDLVKRTELSRSFFYKNPQVSSYLAKARRKQEGKVFHQRKKVILDYAVEQQNELIKREFEKSKRKNEELQRENEKLKKALRKKDLDFIKQI